MSKNKNALYSQLFSNENNIRLDCLKFHIVDSFDKMTYNQTGNYLNH